MIENRSEQPGLVQRPRAEIQRFTAQPQSFAEMRDMAEMLAKSNMVPECYRGRPADIVVAIQMGIELEVSATQALQGIAIINGRPSVWGPLGQALLRRRGADIVMDDLPKIREQGFAVVTISGLGRTPVTRTFGIQDAKDAGLWDARATVYSVKSQKQIPNPSPWFCYPLRMMMWRAFWIAAVDFGSDILKGLRGAEEMRDIPQDEPVAPGGGTPAGRDAVAAGKLNLDGFQKAAVPVIDIESVEITPVPPGAAEPAVDRRDPPAGATWRGAPAGPPYTIEQAFKEIREASTPDDVRAVLETAKNRIPFAEDFGLIELAALKRITETGGKS